MTGTVIVQRPFAGMLAPLSLSDAVVFASDIPVPVQVVATTAVVAINKLPGSVALKLDWMSVKPFGFERVMVSVATPFSPTLAGKKTPQRSARTGSRSTWPGTPWRWCLRIWARYWLPSLR